jgi:hypothetical protein
MNPSIWQQLESHFRSTLGTAQKNSVLLIDEADIFLDKNYIG